MDRLHAQVFEREHARTPDGFRQEVCGPADCDQVGRAVPAYRLDGFRPSLGLGRPSSRAGGTWIRLA